SEAVGSAASAESLHEKSPVQHAERGFFSVALNLPSEPLYLGLGVLLLAIGREILLAAARSQETAVVLLLLDAQFAIRLADAIQANHHIIAGGERHATEGGAFTLGLGHPEHCLQHGRCDAVLAPGCRLDRLPLPFDLATFTERCQQLVAFTTYLLGGLAVLQLLENTIAHCFERLHFRLEVLLDTHGNDSIWIE